MGRDFQGPKRHVNHYWTAEELAKGRNNILQLLLLLPPRHALTNLDLTQTFKCFIIFFDISVQKTFYFNIINIDCTATVLSEFEGISLLMNSKLVVKVLKSNGVKIHDDNSITLLRATVHSQTNSRQGGVCAYQYVGHYNLISFYEYLLPQSTTGRPASIRTGSLNSAQILSLFFLFS